MTKNFYTQDEACQKLDMTPDQLKDLVRNGRLREFRDAGKVTYKINEVDEIAAAVDTEEGGEASLSGSVGDLDMLSTAELTLEDSASDSRDESLELRLADDDAPAPSKGAGRPSSDALPPDKSAAGSTADIMGTGELVLEPADAEGSGIKLGTGSDADAVSLDDTAAEESEDDAKEGTVVSSIGVSVFDDDEVEEDADPLAQTVVSGGTEALGIDGVGSGSGLLDLTRESDDTSLGAELLDEIYPGDEEPEMGEATRAGLEEALVEPVAASASFAPAEVVAAAPRAAVRMRAEYGPDALSTGLTGVLFVGILVMCVAGLAGAAAVQDVWPTILQIFYEQNWIVGVASLAAAVIALAIGYFVGKRSNGS